MTSLGYRKHETDWEIHRGGRHDEVISDVKISCDGKYVWTKLEKDKNQSIYTGRYPYSSYQKWALPRSLQAVKTSENT
jgi:hypothetical protein